MSKGLLRILCVTEPLSTTLSGLSAELGVAAAAAFYFLDVSE